MHIPLPTQIFLHVMLLARVANSNLTKLFLFKLSPGLVFNVVAERPFGVPMSLFKVPDFEPLRLSSWLHAYTRCGEHQMMSQIIGSLPWEACLEFPVPVLSMPRPDCCGHRDCDSADGRPCCVCECVCVCICCALEKDKCNHFIKNINS